MITISKEFSWSSAHRILFHPKCGRLHGHNYRMEVQLRYDGDLDAMGFVVDFGDLKSVVKPMIDLVDHRYIVAWGGGPREDKVYEALRHENPDWFVDLPIMTTSAENLSEYFAKAVWNALVYDSNLGLVGPQLHVIVRLWETDSNWAECMYGGEHAGE